MTNKLTVSVVIPALNEAEYISATLASLTQQEYAGSFEIIVVDNGSTDRTPMIARKCGAKVFIERVPGVAHARQRGFSVARGTYILTTDADTIAPRNWIQSISDIFDNYTDVVAVGGPVSYSFDELYFKELFNRAIPFLHELDRRVHGGNAHLVGANLAVRAETFRRAGGFQTALKLGEDMDLAHRLAGFGRIHFAPELRVTTSPRRFRQDGPQALLNYFQNYLEVTRPAESLRRQLADVLSEIRGNISSTREHFRRNRDSGE